jgi:hypothetical protein
VREMAANFPVPGHENYSDALISDDE